MNSSISLHDVENAEVQVIEWHSRDRVYYTVKLQVSQEKGNKTEITLFASDIEVAARLCPDATRNRNTVKCSD